MSELPAEVKQWIDRQIESLAQLETLLLLRQSPDRTLSVDEVAKALYVPATSAMAVLRELERRGMIKGINSSPPSFGFQPTDDSTGKVVDQLAQLYAERRVAVISHIYSKSTSKVQTFADAFRLKKEP
jgi:hypothetical protein